MKKRSVDTSRMRKMKRSKISERLSESIGYPVVYLGFDATCYFTSIVKLRIQKAVQKENHFNTQLLQQALPPGLQLYPRYETVCKESSKWMAKSDCTQYQCQSGAVVTDVKYLLDYSQIDCKDTNNDMEDTKPNDQSFQPSTFKANESDNKENCLNRSQTCETSGSSECLPQEEQGAKVQRTAKNTSPKVRKMLNRILVPIVKGEKKQKSSTKNISPNWEMSEQSLSANQNTPSEQIRKLEQEVKKLKSDLLTNKQSEQELRSHFCNLTNSERSLRPEISLLRQANDLLQNKIAFVIKTKQRDKQATILLEKKISSEMEARAIIEKQLSDLRTRKTDETSAVTQGALLFTTRQEHTVSLKKKAKELETDWNQLQKEFQAKESQIINLENEVEVRRNCGQQTVRPTPCRSMRKEQRGRCKISSIAKPNDAPGILACPVTPPYPCRGICKKFAAGPINASMELGNGGKPVSEAISELRSATVDVPSSCSSTIYVGKESSSQKATKDSVSSSAIKGCGSSSTWASMVDPGAESDAGGSGAGAFTSAAGACCLDSSSRTSAICSLR
ncbi:UNVERIFIED_CONTAM: hypothetical protein FKN15_042475 [Acipenser sinensis]